MNKNVILALMKIDTLYNTASLNYLNEKFKETKIEDT